MEKVERREIKEVILKYALMNALSHDGKALVNPVIGRLISESPHLKVVIHELRSLANEVIEEINKLSMMDQKNLLEKLGAEVQSKIESEKMRDKLPPLPNAEKYGRIVTRFSPNPDCVLHLGSARAIILSHDYARMYGGKFILRFEDTDPRLKRSALKFYEYIREDLVWLGCKWDEEYIQSDRLPIYYEYAEELIRLGKAYICTCKREEFHKLIITKTPCPCRDLNPNENIYRWKSMLNHEYNEGEAVLRVKTDIDHPNPAVRDWPAFRVIDMKRYPHPRVGDKYVVWPLYNFACGIDDHLMGVTHIIRGKEHITNQIRQGYLYKYFGWEYPETVHYGRLKITGAVLSKSKIVRGVETGLYKHWSDPRLATLKALRRRGIHPEAIRRMMLEIGPKPVDITLSWENLYAYNRKVIDPHANRYFFVDNPKKLIVYDLPHPFHVKIPLHPQHLEKGFRTYELIPKDNVAEFWISSRDLELAKAKVYVRLMGLFNIENEESKEDYLKARFISESYEEAKRRRMPLIHWLLYNKGIPTKVVMQDATEVEGLAEDYCRTLSLGTVIQFERFGFVRLDSVDDSLITFFYAHR